MFVYAYVISGRINTKLLMPVLLEKEIGKLLCVSNNECSHPFFSSRKRGKTTFPNVPSRRDLTNGNEGRGTCHFSSKAIKQHASFPHSPDPQPLSHWSSWDQRTLRWWRRWIEEAGIWVTAGGEEYANRIPHTVIWVRNQPLLC